MVGGVYLSQEFVLKFKKKSVAKRLMETLKGVPGEINLKFCTIN